jgi:hypothetical protein
MSAVVKIARCEIHGLHGERERCYVCDRPCEQVEMVEASEVERLQTVVDEINQLRSNVIATQNASWSNMMYPLVAILDGADIDLITDVSDEQKRQHLLCYGGAGGTPGAPR